MRHHPLEQLRYRLIAAMLLPVLLVTTALSVPMIGQRQVQLLEQAQLRARLAGQTASAVFTERLSFARLLIELLAERPLLTQSLDAGDLAAVQTFVTQTRTDTLFDLVTLVDANGQIIAQDGATTLWAAPRLDESMVFRGVAGVGLVVQVTHSIQLSERSTGYLVGTFIVGDALLANVRAQTDLDQSILVDNRLVATSKVEREQAAMGRLLNNSGASATFSVTPDVVETAIDGVPYLAHYAPLHAPGGEVVADAELLVPLSPVRAAQQQATITLLAIALLCGCVSALVGWLLGRRLIRPLKRLVLAAQTLGSNLQQPIQIDGPREVRVVSEALEQMRQQVHSTQSALEAERARYANIVESVEESIITLDPQGIITGLNHSTEALFQVRRDQVIGQPLQSFIALASGEGLSLAHIPMSGAVPLAVRTGADRRLTLAATRSAVQGQRAGKIDEQIVVLRDITDEVAVRELKDAFLSNVTHEFRTPLAALIASLEILREEGPTLTPEERQQMLDTVHTGVQRLDTLVQNLLDSASLQAGYFRVHPDDTAIEPLVDEAVALMEPLVKQRRQRIVVEPCPGLPIVLADGQRLIQVLVNVLSNASKFGPRGDSLFVRCGATASEVSICITDHGPGIAPDQQPRIFERFLRPGSATVRAQGAGLGLAIAKAIIELHHGTIQVDSRLGETTFTISLPRTSVGGTASQYHEVGYESATRR